MPDGFFHYSFLDGRLIGSEYPGAVGPALVQITRMMAGRGSTALLTLTPRFARYPVPGLVQYHLPLPSPPSHSQVADAVEVVRGHLAAGDRVWVHCQHGLDRTGCVIGAYLCQSGVGADEVIAMLLARFPPRRRHPRMLEFWRPFEELIRSFGDPGGVSGVR